MQYSIEEVNQEDKQERRDMEGEDHEGENGNFSSPKSQNLESSIDSIRFGIKLKGK